MFTIFQRRYRKCSVAVVPRGDYCNINCRIFENCGGISGRLLKTEFPAGVNTADPAGAGKTVQVRPGGLERRNKYL